MSQERAELQTFPILPLRGMVIYPNIISPLLVRREKSTRCLNTAVKKEQHILLLAQRNSAVKEPEAPDLYEVGTVATVLERFELPQGMLRVLVKGLHRAHVTEIAWTEKKYMLGTVTPFQEINLETAEEFALIRVILDEFEQYIRLSEKIPIELLKPLKELDDPARLADTIAAHMPLTLENKQRLLELPSVASRLELLLSKIRVAIELSEIDRKIRKRVEHQLEKNQREYYLNEQIKAIQKELTDPDDMVPDEQDQFKKKFAEAKLPKEVQSKAEAELKKLKSMPGISAEATVIRSYLDWLIQVPWGKRTRIKKDLVKAAEILDAQHYGLERVKDRILEYLAVQARLHRARGPILCFVGPPGVGKTSLGKSIAEATGRVYVRMALGGIRDEAEIRGHRRTYIGSMPGRIIQKMAKAGVKNPLFLLDEIDKLASDLRGDPASALLEVLDPEQNTAFNDHYLEVDYDLSEVMFVATSNTTEIPPALLDRMEIVRLSSYTEEEKKHITIKHLLPKQLERNGLKPNELCITEEAVYALIRHYTREAGVRGLERELAKLCRKVVKKLALTQQAVPIKVDAEHLTEWLGVPTFDYGRAQLEPKIGQVTGLAWTSVGGELLVIEARATQGRGKLLQTGSLGKVMKESIQAALTAVRDLESPWKIDPEFLAKRDIHVHVPEGATPKDGPSAGIAVATALTSVLTSTPVKPDVAMTGEVMLSGEVLPIGGLKDKLLAAKRGGAKTVLIPEKNKKDLDEIPEEAKTSLSIVPVSHVTEVLKLALLPKSSEWVET